MSQQLYMSTAISPFNVDFFLTDSTGIWCDMAGREGSADHEVFAFPTKNREDFLRYVRFLLLVPLAIPTPD